MLKIRLVCGLICLGSIASVIGCAKEEVTLLDSSPPDPNGPPRPRKGPRNTLGLETKEPPKYNPGS